MQTIKFFFIMKTKLALLLFFCCSLIFAQQWNKTGGPIGGLGYNIKIHPTNNQIIYITDAFSGVHKSVDGGETWVQKNNGITSRSGISNDKIPVFVIGIDQNNPTTIWAGTQYDSGIYISTDSAENWTKKNNGITETNIVFREISVINGNSNIVYASGEVPTGNQGNEFEKVKGIIYKTIDGGENWMKIWEGDSLARWLCINGNNANILTVSTGIFDREANNTSGVGIIKSIDGGTNWVESNSGITGSLFIGGMTDAGNSPNLIYAATGNNAEVNMNPSISGGVFKSIDFGNSWTQVIAPTEMILPGYSEKIFNTVKIAPSNNNIVYAASAYAFFKSTDAGVNWSGYRGGVNGAPLPWGPRGIRAGVPIEIVIDKEDANTIFAANYGGGIFKSTDGAQTWNVLGTGYTGATVHKIAIDNQNSKSFLTVGRSGPFRSDNNGASYTGLYFGDAGGVAEWYSAAIHPSNNNIMFITDEHEGLILKSTDGGQNWVQKFNHPNASAGAFTDRHGVKEIVISPSNPSTIYAGFAYQQFYNNPSKSNFQNSYGVYKSIDSGENWSQVGHQTSIPNTNLNITAMAVNSTDENNIYIGLRESVGSGIYHSTNGGTTWSPIGLNLPGKSVFGIALAENNAVIYVATKSNGVYRSSNNGISWEQLLEGSSNKLLTAIAVNPTNKNNIVAGDIKNGIYMSIDGGKSWNIVNSGLSNRAITSLVFSKDGTSLYAGTLGQGIFTYDTSTLSNQKNLSLIVKNIYPNPSKEKITLNLQKNNFSVIEVTIFDVNGKKNFNKQYKPNSNSLEISTNFLESGLYIIEVIANNYQKFKSKILIE